MIQTSLFANGAFIIPGVLDNPTTEAPAVTETALPAVLEDVVVREPVIEVPAGPRYSEKAWIEEQVQHLDRGLVLYKLGTKAVVARPTTLAAAAMLHEYKHSEPVYKKSKETSERRKQQLLEEELIESQALDESALSGVGLALRAFWKAFPTKNEETSLHFPVSLAIAPSFESSFLFKHLEQAGFEVVGSPSLSNWVKRQYKKIQKDLAYFDLPDEVDDRPLFERIERSYVLNCIKSDEDRKLIAGEKYIVCSMFNDATEDYVGIKRMGAVSEMIKWTALDPPLEEFFTPEDDDKLIYVPGESIRDKYPDQIKAAEKKLSALNLELFEHTAYDAVQGSLKNNIYLGKPMRMGKTREALAIAEIWDPRNRDGSKQSTYIVTPPNVRRYVKDELEKKLGINDYVMVDSVYDLDRPERYKLITYNWLKNKKDWDIGSHGYVYPVLFKCPYCGDHLVRDRKKTLVKSETFSNVLSAVPDYSDWEPTYYGWSCANQDCSHKGYVDFGRKAHWNCIIEYLISFTFNEKKYGTKQSQIDAELRRLCFSAGRACKFCGYTERPWVPARARRLKKKKIGTVIVDELHNMASGRATAQGAAILSLKAKRRIGMTGTLMPNHPTDPYYPLHWLFVGGSHRFPYVGSGTRGLLLYSKHFQEVAYLHDQAKGATKTQKLPYLRSPKRFRRMMASKMIRRTYNDPMVKRSLEAAGLVNPDVSIIPVMVDAHPKQLSLLDATLNEFLAEYAGYLEELKKQSAEKGKLVAPNSAQVFPMMMRMRIAATVPDWINDKMKALGLPDFYDGPVGGAKLQAIKDQVWSSVQNGGKVVIFSFFNKQRQNLANALELFNPILFDTKWNEEKRFKVQEEFREDPSQNIFIVNPYSLAEGSDLAPASGDVSCILVDLPWNPGKAAQAWSRILKPMPQYRLCPIYLFLARHSIDETMYNTFYGKMIASEQAFDGKILTRTEKKVDVGWFVDQVAKSKTLIQAALLEAGQPETVYVPMLDMLDFGERDA